MSTPGQEPNAADESSPLELNKETLQDLDLDAADADGVKGGGSAVYPVLKISYQYTETGTLSGVRGSIYPSGGV